MFSMFHYEFIQNSFLTGAIIGFLAPLLGVFIVVRRMSLIADALSHVTLAGIAFSMYMQKVNPAFALVNPLFAGMMFSVFGSILIERLRMVYKHFQELAIPIILSAGMGLSVIFISLADGFNTDLFNYLFGSISAVTRTDTITIFFIAIVVVALIVIFYKEWFLISFDQEHAKASGINTNVFQLIFIVLVALVIASSMRIVGVLLVSSLMTLPVAASIRIAKGFKQTIIYSIIFGEISVIGGMFLAYYIDLAPGGTIVLISIVILLGTILWNKVSRR